MFTTEVHKEIKELVNQLILITGLGITMFADFGSFSTKMLETKTMQLLMTNSNSLTLEDAKLIVDMIMRVGTGGSTILFAYLYYKHKTKKDQ